MRGVAAACGVWAALGLAACQPAASPPAPDAALGVGAPYVKREGVSLADATVALASLDGAPEGAAQDFRAALTSAFAARGVATADAAKARYRLRVYLAASADEGGASLDYVVDVYDAGRRRVGRLHDSFSAKGSGDPWSQMSAEAMKAVAGACADEVAAFLSNAPEAKPAEDKPAQALSYAPN